MEITLAKKMIPPIKIIKRNIDIISYILFHNFSNSLFDAEFPSKRKEADITPFYKKEEKDLKEN